jgi:hypothetical protein
MRAEGRNKIPAHRCEKKEYNSAEPGGQDL